MQGTIRRTVGPNVRKRRLRALTRGALWGLVFATALLLAEDLLDLARRAHDPKLRQDARALVLASTPYADAVRLARERDEVTRITGPRPEPELVRFTLADDPQGTRLSFAAHLQGRDGGGLLDVEAGVARADGAPGGWRLERATFTADQGGPPIDLLPRP
jgi:hypothetical protein